MGSCCSTASADKALTQWSQCPASKTAKTEHSSNLLYLSFMLLLLGQVALLLALVGCTDLGGSLVLQKHQKSTEEESRPMIYSSQDKD